MILPRSLELIAFSLLFGALVVTHFTRMGWFLFLCGFVLPLTVPRLEIGIGLDFCKLVAPVGLMLLVIRGKRPGPAKTSARPMGAFIVYACVVTIIWMVLEYTWLQRYRIVQAMNIGAGSGQSTLKMPVQLGSVVGQFLCAFLVPWLARDESEAKLAIRGYAWGCGTSVVAGLFSYLVSGVATVNVYRDADVVGSGRVGGLSGEPKFLGAFLVPLVILTFCRLIFDRRVGIRRAVLPFAAALLAQVLTVSASAWTATAAGLAVACLLAFVHVGKSRLGVLLVAVGMSVLALASSAFMSDFVQTRFLSRFTGETSQLADQKDAYVIRLLSDEPENVFFGYGLGGGDLSLAPYMEYLHLKYGRTPTPGVNGPRLLVDLGAVGILLLIAISAFWWRRLSRQGDHATGAAALATVVGLMFCSLFAVPGYYFLMGACLAMAPLRKAALASSPESPELQTTSGVATAC